MMSLSSKTAKLHAGLSIMAIVIFFPLLVHLSSDLYVCLIGLIVLFAVGLMAFVRRPIFVYPKGAAPGEIERIEFNQRFLPFLATAGLLFLYVRTGKIIAIGSYMFLENLLLSEILLGIYTVAMLVVAFFLIYLAAQPLIVEFPVSDMVRIQKGKETHEAMLADINVRREKKHLVIEGKNWQMKITGDDDKAIETLYSYLYYRIHPTLSHKTKVKERKIGER